MAWLLLLLQATVGLAASVVLFWVFLRRSNWVAGEKGKKKGLREAPEPPRRLPVIGHLHLLRGDGHPAEKLGSLADKYGPAFTLRLGARATLVVSSCDLARECFTGANDRAFATRPPSAAGELMGYNYAMFGFAPYGPYWREIRKMATLHVLSNARLDSLSHVRAAEVHAQAKKLYRSWAGGGGRPAEINVREWCADLTHNVMLQMVVGRRFSDGGGVEGWKFKQAIERFFRLLLPSVALDAIPLLGWVDWGGTKRDMKRTAAEMDSVLSVWLEEHKIRTKKGGKDSGEEEEADFMDVMLSRVKELQIEGGYDEDTVVKATCLALIIGGTDTTSVSLAWVLCFTLSHPDVLKMAREELATHVGDRRNVDESDLKNLVYLQAVVKETLRFAPAAALVVTHEAMEECAVGGFRVPAGTRLLVNLRKMQLDPAVWGGDGNDDDPSEFRPERFLTGRGAGVDVRGQHFECIPFGSGRRMCPGVSFALRVIHLVLARMVHGFEMKMEMSADEDWKKRLRLAADPSAANVKMLLTPRLPSHLYE